VDKLHENEDIVRSVNEQLMYLNNVDNTVKLNKKSIKILSDKVKNIMLDCERWMHDTDWHVHWLNSTLHNQSSILVCVRQLEFGLLQLQQNAPSFINTLEYSVLGKLPLS
jgi:hypothetical protein